MAGAFKAFVLAGSAAISTPGEGPVECYDPSLEIQNLNQMAYVMAADPQAINPKDPALQIISQKQLQAFETKAQDHVLQNLNHATGYHANYIGEDGETARYTPGYAYGQYVGKGENADPQEIFNPNAEYRDLGEISDLLQQSAKMNMQGKDGKSHFLNHFTEAYEQQKQAIEVRFSEIRDVRAEHDLCLVTDKDQKALQEYPDIKQQNEQYRDFFEQNKEALKAAGIPSPDIQAGAEPADKPDTEPQPVP